MADEWDVRIGDHLARDERARRFGGAVYGGIQPSITTPNVFVYSDPSRGSVYGYAFDGWSEDGSVFLYTGEGRIGPQRMRAGNLAIARHREAGRALRVFIADGVIEGTQAKNHTYIGEFTIDEELPYTIETAPDEVGELRTVYVFRLRPVDPRALRRDDHDSTADDVDRAGTRQLVAPETDQVTEFETPGVEPATAVKREAELVGRYRQHLEGKGATVKRWKLRAPDQLAPMLTDLYCVEDSELYEAKADASRPHIRLALGQLLDYRRLLLPHPPTKLTVLVPTKPSNSLLGLLHGHAVGAVWVDGATWARSDP